VYGNLIYESTLTHSTTCIAKIATGAPDQLVWFAFSVLRKIKENVKNSKKKSFEV
jgi:hypothetical protein